MILESSDEAKKGVELVKQNTTNYVKTVFKNVDASNQLALTERQILPTNKYFIL